MSLASALIVYFIPYFSGQSISGAFDAYSYAYFVSFNKEFAVSFQRFLILYPGNLEPTSQFFYAVFLHSLVLIPCLLLSKPEQAPIAYICFLSVLIPEATIFLGSPSKEALAICSVMALVMFHINFQSGLNRRSVFLLAYGLLVAEVSRPYFSIVFMAAFILSILPYVNSETRLRVFITIGIVFCLFLVVIFGYYYNWLAQVYTDIRNFLAFFESDLGSDSQIKAFVRGVFLFVFWADQPGVSFIFVAVAFAFLKAAIYYFAIPLVSLPEKHSMPYYTWALSWQVASSLSSIYCGAMLLFTLGTTGLPSKRAKGVFLLAVGLLVLIALSTAIFHVRYRAPAMVAFVAAFSIAHFDSGVVRKPPWVAMQVIYLAAACYAVIMTS